MNHKQVRLVIFTFVLLVFGASQALGQTIYNNSESPLPGNVLSWGFEANSVSEFGDRITFAPATGRNLTTAVLTMSSFGCQSGRWDTMNCVTTPGATFSHPITLNIYNVVAGNQVGSLIGSVTQTFAIPYRPSADFINCPGGQWFDGSTCFNGKAVNLTFNLGGLVVPNNVIFGVAYNTTHYGYTPIVIAPCNATSGGCGYDALNVGLAELALSLSVGSNPAPDDAYQYTIFGSCTGNPIIPFGLDAGCWDGFKPAIKFNAANPPLTKDDCKNGGWQTHTTATGQPFPNQGQCIQYVNTGK